MDDLCTACLVAGRKLFFIGGTGCQRLYLQILKEIPVHEKSVRLHVCWECRELLRRFGEFEELVRTSYMRLLVRLQQDPPPPKLSIARPPRLQTHKLGSYQVPELVLKEEDQGEELRPLKEESVHSEPDAEAFVDAVEVEVAVEEDRKKRRKGSRKKCPTSKPPRARRSASYQDLELPVKKELQEDGQHDRLEDGGFSSDAELRNLKEEALHSEPGAEPLEPPDDARGEVKKGKKRKTSKKQLPVKPNGAVKQPRETKSVPEKEPEMLGGKPKCGECGKVFSSKKTYKYHLNVLHRGQNRFPCPRCGKVYQWKSNLGRHMRTHKARDSGELYCGLCDKRFASVATYRQHLRGARKHVNESEYNFTCHECGKKFVSKTRLRDHVDWDHLQHIKFRCQFCNKPFKCHTSLYVHLQNVHDDKKRKENLCHICGKSYQNSAKLKYHIVAMHTSETPYRCEQCSAAFGWYSSLYRHVREVHYKIKLQPNRIRKAKRPNEVLPPLPPPPPPPNPPHPPLM